jgi:hypothetical protein
VKSQQDPPINIDTELYDLLDKSYAYVGGHVDFRKPSDIPANHTIWYAVDVNGDKVPDAVSFGKSTPYGTKWTGAASDGSVQSKHAMLSQFVKELSTPGNFCEMSDAIMHIMIVRHQIPCVDNQKTVERIIGKPVRWIGAHPEGKYPGYDGFYSRELGGAFHTKILLGKPKM